MRALIHQAALWLARKTVPQSLTGGQWGGTSYVDAFKRNRAPTPNELVAELKNTAWTCASINAQTCASYAPKLFLATNAPDEPAAKRYGAKALTAKRESYLRKLDTLPARVTKATQLVELTDHPLLTLLQQVNPVHNSFDLWELTTFYQEVHGSAYWYLSFGPLGTPDEIWLLPSQNVQPKRRPDSPQIVDHYEYRTGSRVQRFRPDEIIHFRYPDPKDPYTGGISPLRAAWESCALQSDYLSFKKSKFENRAIPDAVITPEEVIGEEERDRMESEWNAKFRRGGAGRVVVAESNLKVHLLNQSIGDLAALAEMGKTKEDIANAFHVPISFFTTSTNLANLYASRAQHMEQAIMPRLRRRDQKLNEQLVPLYDPSRRLFLASEDPILSDIENETKQRDIDMKYGIISINEVRAERGLPPVPWGNVPWLPLNWATTDFPDRELFSPYRGRNSDPTRILERERHTRWPEPEGTGRDEEPPDPQTPAADQPPSRSPKE